MNSGKITSITLFTTLFTLLTMLSAQAMHFKVPQLGYHPDAPKTAILQDIPESIPPEKLDITIFDPEWVAKWELYTGKKMYDIKNISRLTQGKKQTPGTYALLLEFNDFKTEGEYQLTVKDHPDANLKVRFSRFIFWDNMLPTLKSMYLQRSGQSIADQATDFFFYDCYADEQLPIKGSSHAKRKDVGGGWYMDDTYTKNAVFSAVALSKMMSLYEISPKPLNFLKINYPYDEPNRGTVPDYILESKAGLDWLLAMQDYDGGVYAGVMGVNSSCKALDPEDTTLRQILPATIESTASAAAALAMASRVYKDEDMGYSIKLIRASEKAWSYLAAHADSITPDDAPYMLMASTELFLATEKDTYHQGFLNYYSAVPVTMVQPKNPMLIAYIDYVNWVLTQKKEKKPVSQQAQLAAASLKTKIIEGADLILQALKDKPFEGGLNQFGSRSNYRISERAMFLAAAWQWTEDPKYREGLTTSINYLYGMNPLSIQYVTDKKETSVQNMYHRRFKHLNRTPYGFLVDGAFTQANDGKTPAGLDALSYVDHLEARDSNGTSLLNSASLVYLLGATNAAYNLTKERLERPKTLEEQLLGK